MDSGLFQQQLFLKFRSSSWTFWCTALRSSPNFRFRTMSQSLVPQAQPKQIRPRLQRRQPSTYQVHGLSVPAVAQELRNSTSARWFEVTFFDSFALLLFSYLNVTCWSYIIVRYRIVTDFSFSKGPKKAYKISILKKVSNPWITRWKEDLEGAFCSHSHSTLRQSHGPTTRCVATLIHRSANACWCSA